MPIDLDTIITLRASGDADMATLADDGPNPRFALDTKFMLIAFLAWASGGAGNADLQLYQKIPSRPDGQYDQLRRTFPSFGASGGDDFVDWRIPADDDRHWILGPGELWVPVWTNPDSGNMTWVLEVQLAAVIANRSAL